MFLVNFALQGHKSVIANRKKNTDIIFICTNKLRIVQTFSVTIKEIVWTVLI